MTFYLTRVGTALLEIGATSKHLGAELGYLGILHTWGQNLELHPHIHYIVAGGGPSLDGTRWVAARKKFLVSVRVLSKRFRTLFETALKEAFADGKLEFYGQLEHLAVPMVFASWLESTRATQWVVHSKPPFGSPEQTLRYLGRYTHRVAISNHRIKQITDDHVTFEWKDYRRGQSHLLMTLHVHEFMRRFLLHVLPRGFVRIRYGGFMSHRQRVAKLALCRGLLQQFKQPPRAPGHSEQPTVSHAGTTQPPTRPPRKCRTCNQGQLHIVAIIPSQLPPSLGRQRHRRHQSRKKYVNST